MYLREIEKENNVKSRENIKLNILEEPNKYIVVEIGSLCSSM